MDNHLYIDCWSILRYAREDGLGASQILSESLKEVNNNIYGSLDQGKDDLVDLSKIFAG